MKTIGLLGGMSWESTATYYQLLNETIHSRLGGHHACECVLHSFDFARIERLMSREDWPALSALLSQAGVRLREAGAEFLLICTNTMHLMAEEVERAAGIPLLHIADATGAAMLADGKRKAGLLGTRFTMEKDFYAKRLADRYGIETLVPGGEDRTLVHDIIFGELVHGVVTDESRRKLICVIDRLTQRGAEGIILGCTELPLLLTQKDCPAALYDTTALHALAAADYALQ